MRKLLVITFISLCMLTNVFSQEEIDTVSFEYPQGYDSTEMVWKDTFRFQSVYLNDFDIRIEKTIISPKQKGNFSEYFIYFLIIWALVIFALFYSSDYLFFVASTMFNISLINQLVREKNIFHPLLLFVVSITALFSLFFSLKILSMEVNHLLKLSFVLFSFLVIKFLISQLVALVSDYQKEMTIALLYQIIFVGFVSVISTLLLSAHYFGYFFPEKLYFNVVLGLFGISILTYLIVLVRSYRFINTEFTVSFFLYLCTFEFMPLFVVVSYFLHNIE